jgi:hypothetical protein
MEVEFGSGRSEQSLNASGVGSLEKPEDQENNCFSKRLRAKDVPPFSHGSRVASDFLRFIDAFQPIMDEVRRVAP